MKLSPTILLSSILLTAFSNSSYAFTIPTVQNQSKLSSSPSSSIITTTASSTSNRQQHYRFLAASIDNAEEKTKDDESTATAPSSTAATSDSVYMSAQEEQEVREELIQKYLSAGRNLEHAEAEVNKFLSDPERCEQFVEMRRYAKAQANDLGFEFIFQLGGGFAIGLGLNVVVKYYSAYKQVYPNHDGPIPFI